MAKKRGFEEKQGELEEIVRSLEEGEVPLEEAVARYQAGVKLVKELRGQLSAMEKKIEALTADGEVEPFEGSDGETA
ncbi:MAG: exodeoxyribonuclease VII small subunit [Planctomycetota bacterium]